MQGIWWFLVRPLASFFFNLTCRTQTPRSPACHSSIWTSRDSQDGEKQKKTEMETKIRRSVKIWCFQKGMVGWWVRCGSTLGIPTKNCWCFRKNSWHLTNKLVIFFWKLKPHENILPPNFNMPLTNADWKTILSFLGLGPGNFSYVIFFGGGAKNYFSQLWSLSIQTSQQRRIQQDPRGCLFSLGIRGTLFYGFLLVDPFGPHEVLKMQIKDSGSLSMNKPSWKSHVFQNFWRFSAINIT